MNFDLYNSIIKHIYSGLMIIPSEFINFEKTKSLRNNEYLINKSLDLNDGENIFNKKVWSCQGTANNKKIVLLIADCSLDKDILEYCLIVSYEGNPSYGLYLAVGDCSPDPLIAFNFEGKGWLECTTYLQATFLAAMEQLKEINIDWIKNNDFEKDFKLLTSFLEFHNSKYGE